LAERAQRKFAVQKPKPGLKQGAPKGASQWETIALVDTLGQGQAEFADAVRVHPTTFVRLIQVDFVGSGALANYDWHLIELHDPLKGRRRGGGDANVVSLAARRKANKKQASAASAFNGWDEPQEQPGGRRTLIAFLLFAAVAVGVWLFVGQL
jgi:hypothetical protein